MHRRTVCLDQRRARKLTFLGIVARQFLSTAETEAAPSIPWFAATQYIKCKQNLAGLARKGFFISAEAVERIVGQIGETQKATRRTLAEEDGLSMSPVPGIIGRG